MKIDNERPYHSNVFHELVSNGGPKVDDEVERETKNNLLADKMVEQTNPSDRNFVKAEHQNGGKTRQIRIEDISYDKDVVEINLPDALVSSDYGVHFVKDVCIDDGVVADQKASAEKVVSEKVSPNFDSSMSNRNGNLMEEIRVDSVKTAHELKSEMVTLHEACATDDTTVEECSYCKVRELEGKNTTDDLTNLNNEKLSPEQLVSYEAARQYLQVGTEISETDESHKPFRDGEAIDEVLSTNDCRETAAKIATETSSLNGLRVESTADGFSASILEEGVGGELDERGSNQVNHYNPFIAYGSLEDTWEPKYTLPTLVDDVSVVPICPVGKTDSFSDLLNGGALGGFDFVETAESRIGGGRLGSVGAHSSTLGVPASEESDDQRESRVEKTDSFSDLIDGAPGRFDSIGTDESRIKHTRLDSIEESSSRLDVQASEESNDQIEDLASEMRTDESPGTGISSSEPSDVKSEDHKKCENDTVQDAHDFNPRGMEDGTNVTEDNTVSKSSVLAQTESTVQQNGPDSAKLSARTAIRNPFESSFSGPSITSDPLTPSGHIGNVSLRSDSSTTSTRSFAFPVSTGYCKL
ncbi:hypothetical protein BRADI_5g12830v3 [Brachypodium distachyon]|uniref:Uncharacterized protein n=1 Tax=Brachypodium distachyon TaxID=15368 RepID=A0A0Q3IAA1_BRADI|nr:hypothetical protein BRADI_5g12830v3 [Brachypodium distachyon]